MSESARRVVLLARPGTACERLRSAIGDAGAELVLEGDPTAVEPTALGALSPDVVVVALDPVTEDALDRFDAVLSDPGIEVIFEEAQLAANREGWDLARWARHLTAKLHRHDDVLPPGHEPEDGALEPATDAVAASVVAAAPTLEVAPVEMTPVAAVQGATVEIAAVDVEHVEASIEIAAIESDAPDGMTVEEITVESFEAPAFEVAAIEPETRPQAPSHSAFDPVLAEMSDEPLSFDLDELAFDVTVTDAQPAPVAVEAFDAGFDFDAAPAVQAAVAEPPPVLLFEVSREVAAQELASHDQASHDAAPAQASDAQAERPSVAAPDWSFADEAAAAPASNESGHRFNRDLDALEQRISSLELVDDRQGAGLKGAVLVLAGIGGPDAVRQFLGALPEGFARPVLVQQRLDGGRFDKLVAQMQRATPLLVKLAEPGMSAIEGVIYILPSGLSVTSTASGIRFVEDDGDVMAALPPADSAVLLLSGADPARVDAAMNHAWGGAIVAGQAPDGCYDATAATALIARGGESGQPADLANRLAARWR